MFSNPILFFYGGWSSLPLALSPIFKVSMLLLYTLEYYLLTEGSLALYSYFYSQFNRLYIKNISIIERLVETFNLMVT